MILIEYPKCSTCKKAKKYLEDKYVTFTDRNIVTDTPTKEELKEWVEKFSFPLDKLYNTSGIKYRELNLKEKRKTMNTEEQLELLSSDGMLIKRPILLTEHTMLTGFKELEWNKVIEEEIK
ncbi:MAG: arsenate reductase family protein [bacterium]|nr:arsenate reductase family protein [Mycoplasmatota bacterium]MDD6757262.1 arsenate reductase family protein [bacterium]MDY2908572.1 arsenate reductase family protein [Candidatus Faecimonas sp.]